MFSMLLRPRNPQYDRRIPQRPTSRPYSDCASLGCREAVDSMEFTKQFRFIQRPIAPAMDFFRQTAKSAMGDKDQGVAWFGRVWASLPVYLGAIGIIHLIKSPKPLDEAPPTFVRLVAEVALGIWAYDFAFYWLHLLMHTFPRLPHGHNVHHELKVAEVGEAKVSFLEAESVVHHSFWDGGMQVLVNIAMQNLPLFGLPKHKLSRFIHNALVTYLLVETHSGLDLPWGIHRICPAVFGGAHRHEIHHQTHRSCFHQFFKKTWTTSSDTARHTRRRRGPRSAPWIEAGVAERRGPTRPVVCVGVGAHVRARFRCGEGGARRGLYGGPLHEHVSGRRRGRSVGGAQALGSTCEGTRGPRRARPHRRFASCARECRIAFAHDPLCRRQARRGAPQTARTCARATTTAQPADARARARECAALCSSSRRGGDQAGFRRAEAHRWGSSLPPLVALHGGGGEANPLRRCNRAAPVGAHGFPVHVAQAVRTGVELTQRIECGARVARHRAVPPCCRHPPRSRTCRRSAVIEERRRRAWPAGARPEARLERRLVVPE